MSCFTEGGKSLAPPRRAQRVLAMHWHGGGLTSRFCMLSYVCKSPGLSCSFSMMVSPGYLPTCYVRYLAALGRLVGSPCSNGRNTHHPEGVKGGPLNRDKPVHRREKPADPRSMDQKPNRRSRTGTGFRGEGTGNCKGWRRSLELSNFFSLSKSSSHPRRHRSIG